MFILYISFSFAHPLCISKARKKKHKANIAHDELKMVCDVKQALYALLLLPLSVHTNDMKLNYANSMRMIQ